jgi:hypothetical protein
LNINTYIYVFILIFHRFILNFYSEFIKSLVDKHMPNKIKVLISDKFHNKLEKVIDYNNKFMLIMFIINSIILIAMILLNIFASSELVGNIDDCVEVYNYLINNNNKSILLIILFIPKNKKFYLNIRKEYNWISLDEFNKGIKTSTINNKFKRFYLTPQS